MGFGCDRCFWDGAYDLRFTCVYLKQGLDLPDVKIVVQWRAPQDLCTLCQRFGRAGREAGTEDVAILIAEKAHFDVERGKSLGQKKARKRKARGQGAGPRMKRAAITSCMNLPESVEDMGEEEREEEDAAEGGGASDQDDENEEVLHVLQR